MGRSQTIRYVLYLVSSDGRDCGPMEWRVGRRYGARGYGRPSATNLARYVAGFEQSLAGVNSHLGVYQVMEAWVVDQRTGEEVCRWKRHTH
jgi:hypothetical protein